MKYPLYDAVHVVAQIKVDQALIENGGTELWQCLETDIGGVKLNSDIAHTSACCLTVFLVCSNKRKIGRIPYREFRTLI